MSSIKIRTEIPGPKSTELLKARESAVARGISTAYPIGVKDAKGATLTDVDGNTYIDLAAGSGSLNVGHSPEPAVHAIMVQLDHFHNENFNADIDEPDVKIPQQLNELMPGEIPKKTDIYNSDAETGDNADKIARLYT